MIARSVIFSLILFTGVHAGAQGLDASSLLQKCARNNISPAFTNSNIPAGKVHCVYGAFIEIIGGEKVLLMESFKSGKFRTAVAALSGVHAQMKTFGTLSEDDLLTASALQTVIAPNVLPPPSASLTLGDLRDFHVSTLRTK